MAEYGFVGSFRLTHSLLYTAQDHFPVNRNRHVCLGPSQTCPQTALINTVAKLKALEEFPGCVQVTADAA